MNATEPPTPVTIDERIAAFAAAVRVELADLPADDVDELVDGLEADLTEQASESDAFETPDAAAYAAELRSAAGLPERVDAPAARVPLGVRWTRRRAAASAWIRSTRAGASLLDFLIALRSVWWLLRGWAVYVVLAVVLGLTGTVPAVPGDNLGGWILLGALVVLSVQWGRGRWLPMRWLRVVRIVVSVAAAIALPFLILGLSGRVQDAFAAEQYANYESGGTPGLAVDGVRVRNIFAYDSTGNPLTDVQLFDQDGRALTTVGAQAEQEDWEFDSYFFAGYGGGPVPVPYTQTGRAPLWNVYPLSEVTVGEDGTIDPADASAPTFPFVLVPAVGAGATPAATPTPTDDAVAPTVTPAP